MKHSVSVWSTIVPQDGQSRVVGAPFVGATAAGGATGLGGAAALGGGGAGLGGALAGAAGGIVTTCSAGTASGISSSFFRRLPRRRKRIAKTTARIRIRNTHQYALRKSGGGAAVMTTVASSVSQFPEASVTLRITVHVPAWP